MIVLRSLVVQPAPELALVRNQHKKIKESRKRAQLRADISNRAGLETDISNRDYEQLAGTEGSGMDDAKALALLARLAKLEQVPTREQVTTPLFNLCAYKALKARSQYN